MAREHEAQQEGTEEQAAGAAEPETDVTGSESEAKAQPRHGRRTKGRAKVIATSDSASGTAMAADGNGPPAPADQGGSGNGKGAGSAVSNVGVTQTPAVRPRAAASSDQPWAERELRSTLKASKQELAGLRRRLKFSYLLLIVMAVGLFVFALAMVGFPALAYYRGEIDEPRFALIAGFGALVLALLLYFRPLERIQALIADATYVSMVKDSFHYQVTLRLMALNTEDARAVARAAGYVAEAAQSSMDLVYTQMQARRAAGLGRPVAG